MLFPGELEAVETTIEYGKAYGFGNLIAHLKRAWALYLMEGNNRLTYADALEATNVAAYPQDFDIKEYAK